MGYLNTILKSHIFISYISLIIFNFFLILPTFSQEEISVEQKNAEIVEFFRASYNLGKYDEAQKIIGQIDEKNYDSETLLLLGNIYDTKNDTKNAINYYKKAISADEKNYKAYYNLALVYSKIKKYELSVENYRQALKIKRDFAQGYYNLGCVYLELQDYKKAKKSFINATIFNPNERKYFYNLAYAYKKLNKEKTAQKILKQL